MNLASPSCSLISSIDLLLFSVESASDQTFETVLTSGHTFQTEVTSDQTQTRPWPSDERIQMLQESFKFTKNLQDSCKNIS